MKTEIRVVEAPSANDAVAEALKKTPNAAQVIRVFVSPYFYMRLMNEYDTYNYILPTGERLVLTNKLRVEVDTELPDYHFVFGYVGDDEPPILRPVALESDTL